MKQGLGIQLETRLEWDSYDLITKDGCKIEVKSAAYIQSWYQKKHSFISFNISHSSTLLENNKYSKEKKIQADIYIFCLLHHKDKSTINSLNLNQWVFYLVATLTLNKVLPNQKTIRLSTIENIKHEKCNYGELKERFEIVKNITV